MYECVAGPYFAHTLHLEEKNLIQVFASAGTEVKNANEIVFQPHFSKGLTFSESHVTWQVEVKCWTSKVSQRIPCTSGIFVTCKRKLMLLWWQLMLTCCVILVIKLVHCISAAIQTALTLTVTVDARQLWERFWILKKYFYFVSYFMTCFILNDHRLYTCIIQIKP